MNTMVIDVPEGVGSVSWWSLPGNANRDELVTACQNAGLDTKFIPSVPTADTCLQRALEDVFKDRNTLVKKSKSGFAVLPKGVDENGNPEFRTNITASLLTERRQFPGLDIQGCGTSYQDAIREAYVANQSLLAQQELSAMMVALVRSLNGIGLHDRGRMYFIPTTEIERWKAYSQAIGSVCQLKVFNLPTMRVDEAIDVLGASVQKEVSERITEINATIRTWMQEVEDAKANGGSVRKIRSDAIDNQEKEIERLIALATTYQTVLGTNLETLKQAAEDAHCALMEAHIARL